MKNYFYLIIISLFISNCTLNKVIKHHGVHFLEKKNEKLIIGVTNKNDIKAMQTLQKTQKQSVISLCKPRRTVHHNSENRY